MDSLSRFVSVNVFDAQRSGMYNVVRLAWQVDVCAHAHKGVAELRERVAHHPIRCAVRVRLSEPTRARRAESHEPRRQPTGDDGPISAILRASS